MAVPIPLERDRVTIGRAIEADVRLNDSRASRLHARITSELDPKTGTTSYRISDLGSTNGTLVNGETITDVALNDGDKIVIGDHLFRFDMLDEIDREFQQQIHRLIAHDELTGLLTSKSFFSDLVGISTLAETGRVIKEALRAGDVASRFGGEEFAAFLLEANYAQALVAAERVRVAMADHEFPVTRMESPGSQSTHRITISIGVAAYPDDATDPIHLVELADSALYRAKRSGRNRICAYRPSLAMTESSLPPRRTS
jgi:diguanylate cyclase (GGDEF)-like protein